MFNKGDDDSVVVSAAVVVAVAVVVVGEEINCCFDWENRVFSYGDNVVNKIDR